MKKLLCVLLAIVLVFSFVACSSTSTDTEEPTTQTTQETQTATEGEEMMWPEEDITITVGFPAGGDADILTRHLATALNAELGVNVIVNNMEGANGSLASEDLVAQNNPEYNFTVVNTPALSANPVTGLTELDYTSFDPVAIFATVSGETLYTSPDAPYSTLEEFIAYATDNDVTIGVAMGGSLYAATAALKDSGLKLNIVDSGDAPSRITALLGGQIDCTFASYTSGRDYVENGDFVELATLCSEPLAVNPDLPAVNSLVPGVFVDSDLVLLAQDGVDPAIVEALNTAIQNVYANDAEYVEKMEAHTFQSADPLSVQETLDSLKLQYDTFQNYAQFLQ